MTEQAQPLFSLGKLLSTPGALDALEQAQVHPFELLRRHWSGDWGDLCDEDKHLNDEAVKGGSRIFSAYILPTNTKVWLITEWDRSATTLLLPSEY